MRALELAFYFHEYPPTANRSLRPLKNEMPVAAVQKAATDGV